MPNARLSVAHYLQVCNLHVFCLGQEIGSVPVLKARMSDSIR